ncbi:hypothetical protein EJB05_55807, partial [Eragrostis curvula]
MAVFLVYRTERTSRRRPDDHRGGSDDRGGAARTTTPTKYPSSAVPHRPYLAVPRCPDSVASPTPSFQPGAAVLWPEPGRPETGRLRRLEDARSAAT